MPKNAKLALVVVAGVALIVGVVAALPKTEAKPSCLKGALVGGTAGHFVHHGLAGAAAGCIIGHHERKEEERKERYQRKEDRDGY